MLPLAPVNMLLKLFGKRFGSSVAVCHTCEKNVPAFLLADVSTLICSWYVGINAVEKTYLLNRGYMWNKIILE